MHHVYTLQKHTSDFDQIVLYMNGLLVKWEVGGSVLSLRGVEKQVLEEIVGLLWSLWCENSKCLIVALTGIKSDSLVILTREAPHHSANWRASSRPCSSWLSQSSYSEWLGIVLPQVPYVMYKFIIYNNLGILYNLFYHIYLYDKSKAGHCV